ncbi:hypothetical protein B0H16DRAFT_1697149 [Mycena metata]|uniref:Uncharacterized protein n=1 Tax=Mycena metata TaxID=1033252 RepID=A0AAD7MRL2_9AGAR|nr:hypothetical protein B0H16DRAFT_1697149 [Mycena metata]
MSNPGPNRSSSGCRDNASLDRLRQREDYTVMLKSMLRGISCAGAKDDLLKFEVEMKRQLAPKGAELLVVLSTQAAQQMMARSPLIGRSAATPKTDAAVNDNQPCKMRSKQRLNSNANTLKAQVFGLWLSRQAAAMKARGASPRLELVRALPRSVPNFATAHGFKRTLTPAHSNVAAPSSFKTVDAIFSSSFLLFKAVGPLYRPSAFSSGQSLVPGRKGDGDVVALAL